MRSSASPSAAFSMALSIEAVKSSSLMTVRETPMTHSRLGSWPFNARDAIAG